MDKITKSYLAIIKEANEYSIANPNFDGSISVNGKVDKEPTDSAEAKKAEIVKNLNTYNLVATIIKHCTYDDIKDNVETVTFDISDIDDLCGEFFKWLNDKYFEAKTKAINDGDWEMPNMVFRPGKVSRKYYQWTDDYDREIKPGYNDERNACTLGQWIQYHAADLENLSGVEEPNWQWRVPNDVVFRNNDYQGFNWDQYTIKIHTVKK